MKHPKPEYVISVRTSTQRSLVESAGLQGLRREAAQAWRGYEGRPLTIRRGGLLVSPRPSPEGGCGWQSAAHAMGASRANAGSHAAF
jgi:hypothetical protein